MSARLFTLHEGSSPLLINVPHCGTELPAALRGRFTEAALALPDTDWHVEKLYAFATALGATLMTATHSRYVVDLNRDPDGVALYPGADNTELCPTRCFDGQPIYRPGQEPQPDEVLARRAEYWQPYHNQLVAQLAAIKSRHGHVLLLDAHSIASQVPRFFSGCLPQLNLGTADGRSCAAPLQAAVTALLSESGMSWVVNGRFKGGYITRRYGCPEQKQNALQLEMTQASYMGEGAPYAWDPSRASALIAVLKALVQKLLVWPQR